MLASLVATGALPSDSHLSIIALFCSSYQLNADGFSLATATTLSVRHCVEQKDMSSPRSRSELAAISLPQAAHVNRSCAQSDEPEEVSEDVR